MPNKKHQGAEEEESNDPTQIENKRLTNEQWSVGGSNMKSTDCVDRKQLTGLLTLAHANEADNNDVMR